MTGKFLLASFKGKDLIEATNINPKASLEFKDLMEKLSLQPDDMEAIRKEIFVFSYFIYADEKRAGYFTNMIMNELK